MRKKLLSISARKKIEMTSIRLCFLILTMLTFLSIGLGQESSNSARNKIELQDIQNLIGEWKGTLTYMDYSSNKPYSMPCEVEIKSKRKNRKLILKYNYPNEPKANNKGKLKISKGRKKLNGKLIVSRSKTMDGNIQITTEYNGKNGNENKKALIRNVYIIGVNKFVIRKEVQFEGSKEWIRRNEYDFKK